MDDFNGDDDDNSPLPTPVFLVQGPNYLDRDCEDEFDHGNVDADG